MNANNIKDLKQLGGLLPGSVKLGGQIQPCTDVVGVIKAVIDAEEQARAHYKEIIKARPVVRRLSSTVKPI